MPANGRPKKDRERDEMRTKSNGAARRAPVACGAAPSASASAMDDATSMDHAHGAGVRKITAGEGGALSL